MKKCKLSLILDSNTKTNIKFIFKMLLMAFGLAIVFEKLSYYGLAGIIILIFCFILNRLWKNREMVMASVRNIETLIFGKPLDKGTWEKGELKAKWKKIKFVWKDDKPINMSWKPFLKALGWLALLILALVILRW